MLQDFEIVRSKRKTLSISVDVFGRVKVRAPYAYPDEKIIAFLREKESWILRKKEEMAAAGVDLPSENLDGYKLLLLGRKNEIVLAHIPSLRYDKENLRIYVPETNAREVLTRWLKAQAKRIISEETAKLAARMGIKYRSVSVTSARGRWGSCSGKDDVHYSFRLLFAPKEVVEYVIVHELSHVRYKNHGRAFWSLVERYEPAWREKRRWLKAHGWLMSVL